MFTAVAIMACMPDGSASLLPVIVKTMTEFRTKNSEILRSSISGRTVRDLASVLALRLLNTGVPGFHSAQESDMEMRRRSDGDKVCLSRDSSLAIYYRITRLIYYSVYYTR